jgi:hypothetical protein
LGSDPVRQYDNGLGTDRQGVTTLEPVYKDAGGDSAWVSWYFKQFTEGASMGFAYTQAGQENSFTWDAMSKGLEIQLPLIARLRDENKLSVKTLGASGKWFREHYKVTPPTAVTVTQGLKGDDRKTVWFDSRFYRINLLWEDGTLRFRDIHLFNENLPSVYETQKAESNECAFLTLPFVDGYLWSKPGILAGLRFKVMLDGREVLLQGGDPIVSDATPGKLQIIWPLKSFEGTLWLDIDERQVKIQMTTKRQVAWWLDLTTAPDSPLPFAQVSPDRVDCRFEGMDYRVLAITGSFSKPTEGSVLRIAPKANSLTLDLSGNK